MLKLYRKIGPMAGGTHVAWGMVGAKSPRYQGMAAIKPISLFRWPWAGTKKINEIRMSKGRNLLRKLKTRLSVEFLKDGDSTSIVPYFIYCFNTRQEIRIVIL